MTSFKSHFRFNKQERSGIFFLLFFIISVQLGYYLYQSITENQSSPLKHDAVIQAEIDSLKAISLKKDTVHMYPFNPISLPILKAIHLVCQLRK